MAEVVALFSSIGYAFIPVSIFVLLQTDPYIEPDGATINSYDLFESSLVCMADGNFLYIAVPPYSVAICC